MHSLNSLYKYNVVLSQDMDRSQQQYTVHSNMSDPNRRIDVLGLCYIAIAYIFIMSISLALQNHLSSPLQQSLEALVAAVSFVDVLGSSLGSLFANRCWRHCK